MRYIQNLQCQSNSLLNFVAGKRKAEDDSGPRNKKEMLQDLIVLGLPYSSTEDDVKEYFSQFGELAHWEVCIFSSLTPLCTLCMI